MLFECFFPQTSSRNGKADKKIFVKDKNKCWFVYFENFM